MKSTEKEITTVDGLGLYACHSEADAARADVVIVHGFGEHSGRYGALSDHLLATGYSVTVYDQRGHGRSEGLGGHIDCFTDYEDDLDRVIGLTYGGGGGRPLFVIGHSMGGLVALRYLAGGRPSKRELVAGAVVSAPLVKVAIPVPAHKVAIARLGARMAPRLRLDNEIDPSYLSRDPEVGRAYAADPLVNRKVSTKWFTEAMLAMQDLQARAGQITAPVFVLHGTEDRLASVEGTRDLFGNIGSADKQLAIYEGYYHELFNEPEKQELFDRVTEWLNLRTDRAG